jgi:hypothetical protein
LLLLSNSEKGQKQDGLRGNGSKPACAKGVVVNRALLAELVGVSLPTIDAWVREGMPYLQRADKKKHQDWQFDTAAVIDWVCMRKRQKLGIYLDSDFDD